MQHREGDVICQLAHTQMISPKAKLQCENCCLKGIFMYLLRLMINKLKWNPVSVFEGWLMKMLCRFLYICIAYVTISYFTHICEYILTNRIVS